MEKEKPYQPTREELEKSRTISDAKLLQEGAEYKLGENQEKHLMLDEEQLIDIFKHENFVGYCQRLPDEKLLELLVLGSRLNKSEFDEDAYGEDHEYDLDEQLNVIKAEIDSRGIDEKVKSKITEEAVRKEQRERAFRDIRYTKREHSLGRMSEEQIFSSETGKFLKNYGGNDEEIIIAACQDNLDYIKYASPRLKSDKNFWLKLMNAVQPVEGGLYKSHPNFSGFAVRDVWEMLPEEFKKDREISKFYHSLTRKKSGGHL